MSKSKKSSPSSAASGGRRQFTKEFKEQAVQMLLDGHSAPSIVERLGLSGTNLLYRWRRELVGQSGKTTEVLDDRVRKLEAELKRVQQERDILKKALAIFGRSG
ncbi:transposase [Crateriforma conspicua]|uniref:Transposase n=1 Tax=Crateriforma conspicua TaxID=2527996 RepID=A0A5C5Y4Z2_9PLAN|nr:transposase [Crateriforma conspicua]TWT68049.1 Transposase [Crateriforma conspicua]TWT68596.1 Transposase [Crateriforma conspicua]TWT68846.1 Transposase [Crateriforma conspicua]TWT69523.1 Transposase [Crateriforma conspicua]TWT69998.1 Transposase [Crateriforma conspicua]